MFSDCSILPQALAVLLAQRTTHLEAHLHAKHEAQMVAALRRLTASTKDGCRWAACDLPLYLSHCGTQGFPWLPQAVLPVKNRLVYLSPVE